MRTTAAHLSLGPQSFNLHPEGRNLKPINTCQRHIGSIQKTYRAQQVNVAKHVRVHVSLTDQGVKDRGNARPLALIDRGRIALTTLPESRPDVAAFDPPNALTSECETYVEIVCRIPRCGCAPRGRQGKYVERVGSVAGFC